MTGLTERQIWHELPYVCGLHYYVIFLRDMAREEYKWEVVLKAITGQGNPQMTEVVSLDSEAEEELV